MIVSLRHFLGWLVSAFHSREDLILENLALRRQLLALHTQQPRRRLTALHKLFWVALRTFRSGWTKQPASVGTGLDKSLDDFLNKKLFDFGYQDPDKIEIHDGSKSYFLTRSGSDWWRPDGKKLDEATVQKLISKIRDLSAEKFQTSGFTTPSLELTVLSNDNKRVEKVLVAKNGETSIARRENEPALYEISISAVAELQKAAADLKPAPDPTK